MVRGTTEQATMAALFDELTSARLQRFPAKGVKLNALTDPRKYSQCSSCETIYDDRLNGVTLDDIAAAMRLSTSAMRFSTSD